jgi:two-component system NtrC family sensor kinase
VKFRVHEKVQDFLPLLNHAHSEVIVRTANAVAMMVHGTHNINVAVGRVSRIVFALKAFSSADNSGAMMLSPLDSGIESALNSYSGAMKLGITLDCQLDMIEPLRCLPEELIQVWSHLIMNALQAMKMHGTLTVRLKKLNNEAVVSFSDTGEGMGTEVLEKIFDPFFTTRTSGEGSGLGLAIVKKIIVKHRGRIDVESEVGKGTTFSVYLPYSD